MSYWCKICFKQVAGDDVYEFLQKFKEQAIAHIPEISENNAAFSPLFKKHSWKNDFEPSRELREATIEWAKSSLFRYRFFYDKELHLLGVYSVDESMFGLFDCVHEFQNSCDQDYDFDTWDGIQYFEDIARKWQGASDESIKAWYKERFNEDWNLEDCSSLDYNRKSAAYREIWENFEHTLYNDDDIVYFSLFGFYDFEAMSRLYVHVEEAVNKTIAKWTKELGKKGNGNGSVNKSDG